MQAVLKWFCSTKYSSVTWQQWLVSFEKAQFPRVGFGETKAICERDTKCEPGVDPKMEGAKQTGHLTGGEGKPDGQRTLEDALTAETLRMLSGEFAVIDGSAVPKMMGIGWGPLFRGTKPAQRVWFGIV